MLLSLLALAAAAALGAELATRTPELRVVDARAGSIQSADGALLAAHEFDGPAELRWVRPISLRPVSRPLRLREDFVSEFALSPDGGRIAVASEMHSRIEFFDLRRWRSLGSMRLMGERGYGGVSGLVWASERRLLALAGPAYSRVTPVVIDPERRRVVHRAAWRGRAIRWQAAGERLVFLAAGHGGSVARHGRLLRFDASGAVRELRLRRIDAGSWRTTPRRWNNVEPGLALDRAGERAFVVSVDGRLVADVDVSAWRLTYHEVSEARSAWRRLRDLIEPPAYAKGPLDLAIRTAQTLPSGVIAVTGEDQNTSAGSAHELKTTPYGVRLIDPLSWTSRSLDGDAQDFTVAGGTLLARRFSCNCANSLPSIGVRAYDSAGELRWQRFAGAGPIVQGAAGDHAYVEIGRRRARRVHVVDAVSGETVRVLRRSGLRLLDPGP